VQSQYESRVPKDLGVGFLRTSDSIKVVRDDLESLISMLRSKQLDPAEPT